MNSIDTDRSMDLHTIDLFETAQEREHYDNLADLYAIIVATQHLEKAYARDAITRKEYVTECNKLIGQFKLAEKAALLENGMTTESFMEIYQMNGYALAKERLLVQGIPMMVKNLEEHQIDNTQYVVMTVQETVQHFITSMDSVKLEQRAVDELQPLLSDLMDSLLRLPETPNDFEPNRKIEKWLSKLNAMRAVEEIDEDDARQLSHDLDSAYADFTRYLRTKK